MKLKPWLINGTIIIIALLISFGITELMIRWWGSYDADGNFELPNYGIIRPYHLPISETERKVAHYLKQADEAFIQYDSLLGWSPRPHAVSANKLYRYNSQGIRSTPQEYSLEPPANQVRVALFGDSFTHADDVPYEESWGYYLEQALNKLGFSVEVINFGVGGYGMDQAYLRWQAVGHVYHPDVVIFGLQMENVLRNVNLIRPIYRHGTGLPFAKPRFILQNGELQLINQPTLPPETVPAIMKNIAEWELIEYERFYQPNDYTNYPWSASKSLSFMIDLSQPDPEERLTYDLTDEPAQVTLAIIKAFETEVEQTGATFLLVHLPRQRHLETTVVGQPLPFDALLETIAQNHHLIRPELSQLEAMADLSLDPLFIGSHYSSLGNQHIAEALLPALSSLLRARLD